MAVNPNYPGVYVTETSTVPHDVTPATTNLTAVLGAFPKGSTTEAVNVGSWAEFVAEFGPLTAGSSYAAYAVNQYFAGGGIGAWIVRLTNHDAIGNETATPASVTIAPDLAPSALITVSASSVGTWADGYSVQFEPSGGIDDKHHRDLVVTPPTPPAGMTPQAAERITGLPIVGSDGTAIGAAQLAQLIASRSTYLSAAPAKEGTNPSDVTPPVLALGTDPDLSTPAAFAAGVGHELQFPGGRLDRLAPNLFNLMCIPDLAVQPIATQAELFGIAQAYCETRRAFLIVDAPPPASVNPASGVTTVDAIGTDASPGLTALTSTWGGHFVGQENITSAAYYPWVQITDPVTQLPRYVPPSGSVAGVYAMTDVNRGVWEAPAGMEVALVGVTGLADPTINDIATGELTAVGINVLRTFPEYGSVVWGARTLAGGDPGNSTFRYVAVRRLTDFIEQSVQQSLRWAVFEPNGPALWSAISLEVTAFMAGLVDTGAFPGGPATAYTVVTCDASTTSPTDVLEGIVNVKIEFAPVNPAEFVILNIRINAASAAS